MNLHNQISPVSGLIAFHMKQKNTMEVNETDILLNIRKSAEWIQNNGKTQLFSSRGAVK